MDTLVQQRTNATVTWNVGWLIRRNVSVVLKSMALLIWTKVVMIMPRVRRYEHDAKTNEFYHSSDWQSVRQLALIRDHYLCQVCKRKGIVKQGNTIHHIVPIKDDWNKRLDLGNLETICMACHNKEHFEKGYSKSKKKIRKNKNIVVFKRNPEL